MPWKTIAYIMSTYHIGTHNLDIRDVLKSYIIARYYGWESNHKETTNPSSTWDIKPTRTIKK